MVSFFEDGEGNVCVGLPQFDQVLIFRSFVSSNGSSQGFKFNDHCEVARIPLAYIGVEISAEETSTTFGQVGLDSLKVGSHAFGIRDGSGNIPITLRHRIKQVQGYGLTAELDLTSSVNRRTGAD